MSRPPPWLFVVLLACLSSSLAGIAKSCDRGKQDAPAPKIGEWR